MDELLLKYLQSRGYHVSKGGNSVESEQERRRLLGDESARTEDASIDRYARQLGLTTEACTANHLLFYGLTGGDPVAYDEAYKKLLDWICNSLDMYRSELHAVAFPVFVHCFLELISKGYSEAARKFYQKYAADHSRLHLEELRTLSLVFSPHHLRENEYVREVLHSKFNVEMSLLSFELLNSFLSQEKLFLLLAIVNERVNLVVTSNQPGLQIQQLQDDVVAGENVVLNNMEPKQDAASGYKTSDELAQVVVVSANPSESEIAVPVTTGAYNVDYMVRVAGGSSTTGTVGNEGHTLEDLHAIPVNWGVLPERKVPNLSGDDDEGDAAVSGMGKETSNGIAGGSSASGVGAASEGGAADADKKNATGAAASSLADTSLKSGDKMKLSNDKAGVNSDGNRKHKRVKLSTDEAMGKKKDLLEETGPLPDRRNAFNAEIMEKLVLRVPATMKEHALQDIQDLLIMAASALRTPKQKKRR
ncbi:Transcription initiation factor TFIID subunit 5 [Phytophthora boehmeriae]|uniref:Transcription initiation factor TFIID subunit 5 n=1 Tax=Phytophthora boehmeriae TaxID=109152 RepID=A0A8T1WVG7_9STRA|nr:Transcription initiation factor TFIID subunit 5 [Phytophthora boehmeriae]